MEPAGAAPFTAMVKSELGGGVKANAVQETEVQPPTTVGRSVVTEQMGVKGAASSPPVKNVIGTPAATPRRPRLQTVPSSVTEPSFAKRQASLGSMVAVRSARSNDVAPCRFARKLFISGRRKFCVHEEERGTLPSSFT